MNNSSKIYIAGHRGLVGSAICRKLEHEGFTNLITRTRSELDLTDQQQVAEFFEKEKPEYVFLAAAKVGGIQANNSFRADFIYENMMIQANILHQSHLGGVQKLLFLGSSCIYPRLCPQPMKEGHLMTGPLEQTNSPYAVAKISGIEMCWSYNQQHGTRFIPVMPTNLYGPGDNFDLETSHVLPALVRKFHLAKLAAAGNQEGIKQDEAHFGPIPDDLKSSLLETRHSALSTKPSALGTQHSVVTIWGSGSPKREFLHVDDLADACHFLMKHEFSPSVYKEQPLYNIGTGTDLTIKALAELIKEITGFTGDLVFDPTKPDGTPRKLLDVSKMSDLGWKARMSLADGLKAVYEWYTDQVKDS